MNPGWEWRPIGLGGVHWRLYWAGETSPARAEVSVGVSRNVRDFRVWTSTDGMSPLSFALIRDAARYAEQLVGAR